MVNVVSFDSFLRSLESKSDLSVLSEARASLFSEHFFRVKEHALLLLESFLVLNVSHV